MLHQLYRLEKHSHIDRSHLIKFKFNGRIYEGFKGDTLASALLANGVRFIARSFKFHRPRGIFTSGSEEPCALVQINSGAESTPNQRATMVDIFDGLEANSINVWPGLNIDLLSINDHLSMLFPAGFYYKTFISPSFLWPTYEQLIRKSAGLGCVPSVADSSRYEKHNIHCDILIIGGGIAGLSAALTAEKSGARVVLVEEQSHLGGNCFDSEGSIDGIPISTWVSNIENQIIKNASCRILKRTTAVIHSDHNFVVLNQKNQDSLGSQTSDFSPRERLWKVRARQVIYATGTLEKPLVFMNNDRPGVMLARSVSKYINFYGVCPGKRVAISGNNDTIYSLAKSLREAGVNVVAISDARPKEHTGESKFTNGKTPVYFEKAPYRVFGNRNVKAVSFGSVNNEGFVLPTGKENKIKCDLLCISGGFDPNLNLISQSGATIKFDTNTSVASVSNISNNCHLAGSVTGENDLSQVINSGISAVGKALEAEGFEVSHITYQDIKGIYGPGIIRSVSTVLSRDRFSKQFVDLHNDVIVGDISLAVQEGYKSVEHLKRYTTSGMGPDQGKTSNFNTLALLSKTLKKPTKTLQTTTYRPPYTPVTFGALAGRDLGQLAEPVRRTALHSCHESLGAVFEDVGQWKRPWYYPKEQETMYDCVNRECNIVRNSVGIFDASTLGKIEINGPDVGTFLNRVYINRFDNLKVGSCRYGLMLGEDGMIVDDGVSARISESKWFMTTTTGNAALIFDRLEELLQCDWPSLKVFLTSVSGQWSTITVAGPNSRFLMSKVTEDVDLANEKFPHLSWRNAKILDIPVRIFRVSYTGELSFEVNVPSGYAELVWQTLMCAGDEYGILPFGTEALHSLRAEKGYIAIGHETDGTVTPDDLGLGGMIKKKEDFIGARSLLRSDTASKMRHQLVGLFPDEKVLEGSPIIDTMEIKPPITKIGHITSSYFSSTLKKPIALALVQDGRARIGSIVQVALPIEQRNVSARVVSSVFYDPEGERIND